MYNFLFYLNITSFYLFFFSLLKFTEESVLKFLFFSSSNLNANLRDIHIDVLDTDKTDVFYESFMCVCHQSTHLVASLSHPLDKKTPTFRGQSLRLMAKLSII